MKSSQKSITGGIYKFLILKLNSTQLNNQVEEKNASDTKPDNKAKIIISVVAVAILAGVVATIVFKKKK